MSDDEFADTLNLCQFLPGPNIIGICMGAKVRPLTIGFIIAGGYVMARAADSGGRVLH
jgi:chromate transport protein ChrA